MSDQEVVEMMNILILMSDEHFKECIDYVENTEMQPDVRRFLKLSLKIAGERRNMVQMPANAQI